jgi:hypothetical protein
MELVKWEVKKQHLGGLGQREGQVKSEAREVGLMQDPMNFASALPAELKFPIEQKPFALWSGVPDVEPK